MTNSCIGGAHAAHQALRGRRYPSASLTRGLGASRCHPEACSNMPSPVQSNSVHFEVGMLHASNPVMLDPVSRLLLYNVRTFNACTGHDRTVIRIPVGSR